MSASEPEAVEVFVIPNGPLKISGAPSTRYCGEHLEVEGDLFLCRCGDSSNAPYCDGTHKRKGFVGSPPEEREEEVRTWEGRSIRTFFNKTTCMHVFYCKPLNALREAELAGDDAAADEIARVVGLCPSGALSYERKDGPGASPSPDGEVAIDIVAGGEVRVLVPFTINHELHERQPENRATLCRCGLSKNKPWCDGRHKARKDFR